MVDSVIKALDEIAPDLAEELIVAKEICDRQWLIELLERPQLKKLIERGIAREEDILSCK